MTIDPLNSYSLQALQDTVNVASSVLQPLNPSGIGATAPTYQGESPIAAQEANSDAVVAATALSGLSGGASSGVSAPTVVPAGNGLLAIA